MRRGRGGGEGERSAENNKIIKTSLTVITCRVDGVRFRRQKGVPVIIARVLFFSCPHSGHDGRETKTAKINARNQ